jgi:hypothetical protein
MKKLRPYLMGSALCVAASVAALSGCQTTPRLNPAPCSEGWFYMVESRVGVLAADGEGPDVGSAEWKLAVDRKLGEISADDGPRPGSAEWCLAVDSLLFPAPRAGY